MRDSVSLPFRALPGLVTAAAVLLLALVACDPPGALIGPTPRLTAAVETDGD